MKSRGFKKWPIVGCVLVLLLAVGVLVFSNPEPRPMVSFSFDKPYASEFTNSGGLQKMRVTILVENLEKIPHDPRFDFYPIIWEGPQRLTDDAWGLYSVKQSRLHPRVQNGKTIRVASLIPCAHPRSDPLKIDVEFEPDAGPIRFFFRVQRPADFGEKARQWLNDQFVFLRSGKLKLARWAVRFEHDYSVATPPIPQITEQEYRESQTNSVASPSHPHGHGGVIGF